MNELNNIQMQKPFVLLLAFSMMMVSDFHSIGDLVLSSSLKNGTINAVSQISFAYYFTGIVAQPLMIVSLIVLLFGVRKNCLLKKERITFGVIYSLWLLLELVCSIYDIKYGYVVSHPELNNFSEELVQIATVRGIANLFVALVGGFFLSFFLFSKFRHSKNKLGVLSVIIFFFTIIVSILVKVLSIFFYPQLFMAVFILLMCIKSVAFVYMMTVDEALG